MGNVAGVVASFAILVGAPGVIGVFTAVALGATLLGVYNSGLAKNIRDAVAPIIDSLKNHDMAKEVSTPVLAPNLTVTDPESIKHHFGGLIRVVTWNPGTMEIKLDTRVLESYVISPPAIPHGGINLPVAPPLANGGGSTITIGIESINGQPSVGPMPSITTVIGGGQDKYACCSAPQQDKYR